LIRRCVGDLDLKFHPAFQPEDIHSFGALGLMRAIKNFKVSRGVPFETFARYRIRGSVYDEVRKESNNHSRGYPNIKVEPFTSEHEILNCVHDNNFNGFGFLAGVVGELPANFRKVLSMYYTEGESLKVIGGELGLSESRACQLKRDAVDRIRRKLKAKGCYRGINEVM